MATVGEDLLKVHIKEGSFSPVYFFFGEEDYMKKYYLGRIKAKAIGDNLPEFNLHEVQGEKTSIEEVIQLSLIVPMMSDYALIVVHEFDFANVDSEKIDELFNGLSEGVIVLFYYQSLKPNRQKASWKRALQLAKKAGLVLNFEKKDSRELTKIVMSAAKKQGCLFPQYLASKFVERVGDDLNLLLNEVNKLCALKGGGEFNAADIEAISVKTLDASAFELTKALLSGNPNAAFEILYELRAGREEPIRILGALNSSYIDMYRVKVAGEKGLEPSAVANFYSYSRDWVLSRAAYNAKKLSLSQLRRSINVLCEADKSLKGVNSDPGVILDELIVKLLLIAARS